MAQRLKTIVWDVDDVLNDLMRDWLEHAQKEGLVDPGRAYGDIAQNPPHRELGIPLEAYLLSLDGFRQDHLEHLRPNPELLAWFSLHGHRCRHIVLTAVPLKAAHLSAAWVMRHFGLWIRSFNVVPSRREDDGLTDYETKKEFLGWWRQADILVDDSELHVDAANELGIKGVLMPRPWNRFRTGPSLQKTLAHLEQLIDSP
jgi:FMN phosphatase YigB (HAD superfamily)